MPARMRALEVSRPGDASERAADRLARDVGRRTPALAAAQPLAADPHGASAYPRLGYDLRNVRIDHDPRVAMAPPAAHPAPPVTTDLLGASGGPLPSPLRHELGARFSHDLRNVRIYHDERAAAAADSYGAEAFTVGQNLYFGRGAYEPQSTAGRQLLIHELAHTVADRGQPLGVRRGGPAGGCARITDQVDEQRDESSRAGLAAHKQIQQFYAGKLAHERRVPRASKDHMDVACPPSGTPEGAADLVKFGHLRADIGEIKSVTGAKYAAPQAFHYFKRANEARHRLQGNETCGGPADRVDRRWDDHWFENAIAERGETPDLSLLDSVVPPDPGEEVGRFRGDRTKWLYVKLEEGGAVLYWCTKTRRRRDDEPEAQRQAMAKPADEQASKPKRVRAELVGWHPGFNQQAHEMKMPMIEPGRQIILAVPSPIFEPVEREEQARRMRQQMRLAQVDLRGVNFISASPTLRIVDAFSDPRVVLILVGATLVAAVVVVAIVEVAAVAAAAEAGALVLDAGAVTVEATTATTTAAVAETGAAAGTTFTTSTGVTLTVIEGGGAAAGTTAAAGGGSMVTGTVLLDKAAAAAAVAGLVTLGMGEDDANAAVAPYVGKPSTAVIDVTSTGGIGAYKIGQAIDVGGATYNAVVAIESPK